MNGVSAPAADLWWVVARIPLAVRRTMLVMAGTTVSLLLIEGGLRAWAPRMVGSFQGLYVLDPDVGYHLKPNAMVDYRTPEYATVVRTNSWGFREREVSVQKAPGTFRILVLGDSFVEALQVPLEDTFHKILEETLNARTARPHYEVVALGVGGFGLMNEYAVWRRYGQQLHPDLVLLMTLSNDVESSLAELAGGTSPPDEARVHQVVQREALQIYGTPQSRFLSSLHTYTLVRNGLCRLPHGRVLYDQAHATPLYKLIMRQRSTKVLAEPLEAELLPGLTPHEWAGFTQLLAWFAEDVAGHGARFFDVFVPTPEQLVEERHQPTVGSVSSEEVVVAPADRFDNLLGRFLRGRDIPYVALAPSMRAAHTPAHPVNFTHDSHWNAYGHRRAAETILAAMLTHPELLEEQTAPSGE